MSPTGPACGRIFDIGRDLPGAPEPVVGQSSVPRYSSRMHRLLDVRPRIAASPGRAVALETAVVTHGLPWPDNLETALEMEREVRDAGAEPATIGVLDGSIVVGLDAQELERMARSETAVKVGARDLAIVAFREGVGGTTVGATVRVAARARVGILATGGIGGVHRDVLDSFDISADLAEIARCPVAVVCAGAKSILDLPRTLEALETLGVPVVGFGTDDLPGFHVASTGNPLEHRVDEVPELARLAALHSDWSGGGLLIVQPPPADVALDRADVERWIGTGLAAAGEKGVAGKEATPFLLDWVARESGGRTVSTNRALLRANAALAGRLAAETTPPG